MTSCVAGELQRVGIDGRLRSKKKASSKRQTPKEKRSVYAAFAAFVGFAGAVFFCFAVTFACLAANSAVTA
jgi:hypothetical protein